MGPLRPESALRVFGGSKCIFYERAGGAREEGAGEGEVDLCAPGQVRGGAGGSSGRVLLPRLLDWHMFNSVLKVCLGSSADPGQGRAWQGRSSVGEAQCSLSLPA